MPRVDYKTCRVCGGHADEVGELSHQRLCGACGRQRFIGNNVGLETMSGPFAQYWRHRIAASVGAVIPEKGH